MTDDDKIRLFDKVIKEFETAKAEQLVDGVWNYSAYMHGLANGIILFDAVMHDKEPEFLVAPEIYKQDVIKHGLNGFIGQDDIVSEDGQCVSGVLHVKE